MFRFLLNLSLVSLSMGLAGPTAGERNAVSQGQGTTSVVEALWRAGKAAVYRATGAAPASASQTAERAPARPADAAAAARTPMPKKPPANRDEKGDEVFTQRCAACHGGKQRVVQNFNALDLNSLKASGYIVFGSPEQSRIWQRVAVASDMPPAQVRPLGVEEKESIRIWLAGRDVPPKKDLIATARDDPRLKFLLKVAQVSGAIELLKNPGPFTILAPTDQAFSGWGESQCQALLDKENRDAAQQLLLNHGVLGKYLAKDLEKLRRVSSARGLMLTVSRNRTDQRLWIGPANAVVVEEDILCSNGVLHIIDQVIVPPDLPLRGTRRGSYWTKIGLKMIEIPGGTFVMGSASPADPGTENEVPQRNVQLSTLYLSEHEVTWEQYQHKALELDNPAPEWIRQIPPGQKPVGSVSWIQAAEFCNKLSRLEGLEPYYAIAEGEEQTRMALS